MTHRQSETVCNAHTHLELTDLAEICPAEPTEFLTWLARLAWRMRARSTAQVKRAIERGIAELESCGTTHVGDISKSWLNLELLWRSRLRGVAYLEVMGHDLRRALPRLERAKAAIRAARRDPHHGAIVAGLSLHAPYSCHPELLQQGAAFCREEDVPLCIHVAESPFEIEAMLGNRIASLRWPLLILARKLRLLPATIAKDRPVRYLARLGVLAARPLLVHAVQISDEEIQTIADHSCPVVHCPRSNHRLACGRMPLERFLAAGVPVYLGTDSRASSPDLDVRAEVAYAAELHRDTVDTGELAALVARELPANVTPAP